MALQKLSDEQLKEAAEQLDMDVEQVKALYEAAMFGVSQKGKEEVSLKEASSQTLVQAMQELLNPTLAGAVQNGKVNLAHARQAMGPGMARTFDLLLKESEHRVQSSKAEADAVQVRETVRSLFSSRKLNPSKAQVGMTTKEARELPGAVESKRFYEAFTSPRLNQHRKPVNASVDVAVHKGAGLIDRLKEAKKAGTAEKFLVEALSVPREQLPRVLEALLS